MKKKYKQSKTDSSTQQTHASHHSESSLEMDDAALDYYFLLKAARICAAVTTGAILTVIVLASIGSVFGVVFGAIAGVSAASCFGLFKTAEDHRPEYEPAQSLMPNLCFG